MASKNIPAMVDRKGAAALLGVRSANLLRDFPELKTMRELGFSAPRAVYLRADVMALRRKGRAGEAASDR